MLIEPLGSSTPKGISERLCRVIAGVDTGFAGGVVVIAWFLFHSWLRGEFWWAKLNVAGALFYGSPVYTMGFGRASLAGASLLLVLYAALGALFGLVARTHGFTRNLLLGMLLAMAWQFVSDRYFWRRLDSFGPAYFPALSTLPAHLIFGLSLSRYAARFRVLALTFGDSSWAGSYMEIEEPKPVGAAKATPMPEQTTAVSSVAVDPAASESGPVDHTAGVLPESAEVTSPAEPSPATTGQSDSSAPSSETPAEPPAGPSSDKPASPRREESNPSSKSDC